MTTPSDDGQSPRDRSVRRTRWIPLADIDVPEGMRQLSEKDMDALLESVESIGMQAPVVVRGRGDRYELVAGQRRLEAVRYAGEEFIEAFAVECNDDECLQMRIAENLHRLEPELLDRARDFKIWERIQKKKGKGAQNAQPGGKQPHDVGVSKGARALGRNRDEIRRLQRIGRIKPAAAAAARIAGLANRQAALLEIAADKDEEAQIAKVEEITRRPKRAEKMDRRMLEKLVEQFHRAKKLRRLVHKASPITRRRFLSEIEKDCAKQDKQ